MQPNTRAGALHLFHDSLGATIASVKMKSDKDAVDVEGVLLKCRKEPFISYLALTSSTNTMFSLFLRFVLLLEGHHAKTFRKTGDVL